MMIDILTNNFVSFLLIFLRIIAMFFSAPILSDNSIPVFVKIVLALFMSYVLLISLNINTPLASLNFTYLTISALKEIIVGLAIGFFMQLIFWGISYGASLIGFDLGLSMATVFNPNLEISGDVVSTLFYILAMLTFLLINGHIFLFTALHESFKLIPPTELKISDSTAQELIIQSANVFIIAVKIASPIMVTFFLMNIAEGIMSRIIPQMQVFFVLYPLRIGVGFLLITTTMIFFFYVIKELLKLHETNLIKFIRVLG
ncbi:MAG: flagellar biosynthetic protein FliR [Ignavibacteria bacterium]|nr:MAG: flagellar biosynthetic protein FliR [Ignavibacteria bacterium]